MCRRSTGCRVVRSHLVEQLGRGYRLFSEATVRDHRVNSLLMPKSPNSLLMVLQNKQKPGEQIEGNPNTVYGILTFPR